MIAYPPLKGKGSPMLTQNRQFQWYSMGSYIYPLVPASAATLLKRDGQEVVWMDAIAERWTPSRFLDFFRRERPDLLALETKTPVVKLHWEIVRQLKAIHSSCRIVLMGDHVTALPQESLEQCPADFVLTGGDYDFSLLGLVRALEGRGELEEGLWYRDGEALRNTGPFRLDHDLDSLPVIDRELTRARLYGEKWRRRAPFFYTQAARDCPWARCTFCSWTTTFPRFRSRSPEGLLEEVGQLIERHGAREIFDDSGTFPGGRWLEEFCEGMLRRGYARKLLFSCNLRFDALRDPRLPRLMKRAGFRKVKCGLESANSQTLERIRKGIRVEDILVGCENAARAGLEVQLTVMVGYPWETRQEARRTVKLARRLMARGWAEMLQATVVIPYPGTPLYTHGVENGLFRFDPQEYDRFDMTEPVFRTPDMSPEEVMSVCQEAYRSFLTPRFVWRKLRGVRSWEDVRYVLRGARAVGGHLLDFGRSRGALPSASAAAGERGSGS